MFLSDAIYSCLYQSVKTKTKKTQHANQTCFLILFRLEIPVYIILWKILPSPLPGLTEISWQNRWKEKREIFIFLCCHVTYSSPICLSQFLLNKLHFIFDSHNLISLWHSLLGSSKHNVTFMTCIAKWNQNTIMPMSFNPLNNIKNVSSFVIHRSENIA